MRVSNFTKAAVAMSLMACAVLLHTHGLASTLAAQGRGTATRETPYKEMPVDKYDRNATLWANERSGYAQGWQRGREIYFMNCWMCHSEYVIAADFMPAPSLRSVAKRLTDAQITTRIQDGGGRMPAFKQLTDADIKDLLALFREKCGTFPTGGGCFDEHNPPPNPLYRFGTDYLAPNAVDAKP